MTDRILYDRKSAAEMLSVSLRQLDRHICFKEIQVRRIGRRTLISRQALEQFARRDHVGPRKDQIWKNTTKF